MINFEVIATGKSLGTLKREADNSLAYSTQTVRDLVASTRRVYQLTDEQVYEYFNSGAYDNGYVRAVPA
jgi:hypothetical protein